MILLITLLILVAVAILAISVGGAAFIIVFGDVIVCVIFIVWIMKRIARRKRR